MHTFKISSSSELLNAIQGAIENVSLFHPLAVTGCWSHTEIHCSPAELRHCSIASPHHCFDHLFPLLAPRLLRNERGRRRNTAESSECSHLPLGLPVQGRRTLAPGMSGTPSPPISLSPTCTPLAHRLHTNSTLPVCITSTSRPTSKHSTPISSLAYSFPKECTAWRMSPQHKAEMAECPRLSRCLSSLPHSALPLVPHPSSLILPNPKLPSQIASPEARPHGLRALSDSPTQGPPDIPMERSVLQCFRASGQLQSPPD